MSKSIKNEYLKEWRRKNRMLKEVLEDTSYVPLIDLSNDLEENSEHQINAECG